MLHFPLDSPMNSFPNLADYQNQDLYSMNQKSVFLTSFPGDWQPLYQWIFSFKKRCKWAILRSGICSCISSAMTDAGILRDLPAVPFVSSEWWGEVWPSPQAGLRTSTKACPHHQRSSPAGLAWPLQLWAAWASPTKIVLSCKKFRALPPPPSAWSKHIRVATWKKTACFSEQFANWITKCHLPAHNKTCNKTFITFPSL